MFLERVIRLSILLWRVLFFPSSLEATAQIAAGSHPKMVIWRIKHRSPWMILPLKKKDSQGSKTAMNSISEKSMKQT